MMLNNGLPKKDIAGKTFGKWRVLKFVEQQKPGNFYWRCKCECGTQRKVSGDHLRDGSSKSCGCNKKIRDRVGETFGKWRVLGFARKGNNYRTYWNCQCACGKVKEVELSNLIQAKGGCKECGQKTANAKNRKGAGEISGSCFSQLKAAARQKKIPVEVTIKDIWDLFLKQDRKCCFTGKNLV